MNATGAFAGGEMGAGLGGLGWRAALFASLGIRWVAADSDIDAFRPGLVKAAMTFAARCGAALVTDGTMQRAYRQAVSAAVQAQRLDAAFDRLQLRCVEHRPGIVQRFVHWCRDKKVIESLTKPMAEIDLISNLGRRIFGEDWNILTPGPGRKPTYICEDDTLMPPPPPEAMPRSAARAPAPTPGTHPGPKPPDGPVSP